MVRPWSGVLVGLAGLAGLAACNGGGGQPPDATGPTIDAALDALGLDADLGPVNLTIHTLSKRVPTAGVDVVISRADGSVRAHLVSDAGGLIHAHVEPGDLATLVDIDQRPAFRYAITVADLQPGDDVVLDPLGADLDAPATTGSIDVVLPATWPGANRYVAVSDCGSLELDGPLPSCRTDGHADVLGVALRHTVFMGMPTDTALAYAARTDVPFGTQVTLGPWAEPAHAPLAVSNPAVPQTWTSAHLALVSAGGAAFGIDAGNSIADFQPYPGTIDLRYVPGLGVGWELSVDASSTNGHSGSLALRRLERQLGPVPASAAIDLAADLLPPLDDVAVEATVPGRPTIRWSGNQNVAGTGVALTITLSHGPRTVLWTAYLPPRTIELQLPAMPPELAALSPTVVETAQVVTVDVIDASWQAWPQFRAATHVRHEADVPVGGLVRRAHLYQVLGP